MKKIEPIERVFILIDGQNMFHGARDLDIKFSYKKLLKILRNQKNILKEYYYTAFDPNNQSQIGFLNWLSKLGLIIRKRLLKKYSSGERKEKGIDVWLATDLNSFTINDEFDRVIILSGDGDFAPTIQFSISNGKKIEIWTWRHSLNSELRKLIKKTKNKIKFLDDLLDQIKIS